MYSYFHYLESYNKFQVFKIQIIMKILIVEKFWLRIMSFGGILFMM